MLRDDPARFGRVYRVLLQAARAEGIGPDRLPDFLGLEHGGELALLGQEELDISVLEAFAQQVLANCGSRCVFCDLQPMAVGARRMLMTGHIKPWKDSTPTERLDPRNGLTVYVPPTIWPLTPACSWSTEVCASILPGRSPRLS
jgi:putative restriction endonuclease